ncbi:glucan biosynthesis protein [Jiella sp. MQZ9-1]|uniref:Glucan biosynthesis protein D n=1 Tax=Jiella flava TaxID=2816857 RepID=A0A939G0P0_9HYPH|nr:glucan biosynthesis protein [Jiella flava]MBO0663641.1 glucan biosynthesis protein D [Jiella flava]MCD2472216.1 glucan biosynthesis protein [Jiella flava]
MRNNIPASAGPDSAGEPSGLNRRSFLTAAAALGLLPATGRAFADDKLLSFEAPKAFSFELLADQARQRAMQPYVPLQPRDPKVLDQIDFDAHWKIKYKPKATLNVAGGKAPVRLFPLGRYFQLPVGIHVVDGGQSRELRYDAAVFDMPGDSPYRQLPKDIGYAGLRVMAPDQQTDWLAFLGAAYFRSAGELNQYGLSARALAIDVAMPTPEEFPRFTDYYLEPSKTIGRDLVITCLIDSPSMTGVFRMDVGKHGPVVMDIDSRFFARKKIARLGLAPLTSMFWFSETDRPDRVDWRPEIHDSDGLALWTGANERIWRPLNNPGEVRTSSFADTSPKGFGLLQRDRSFANYEDDGVFYEKRPSVWVEPTGSWGKGEVQLVEIPTDDEIHDNIVAYWVADEPVEQGDEIPLSYRLTWSKDAPYPPEVSTVTATRIGRGGIPGQPRPKGVVKLAVDFDGGYVAKLDRDAKGVEAVVTSSRGTISNVDCYSVKVGTAWRMTFDLKTDSTDPVDLRAYLKRGEQTLTETWLYQFLPKPNSEA